MGKEVAVKAGFHLPSDLFRGKGALPEIQGFLQGLRHLLIGESGQIVQLRLLGESRFDKAGNRRVQGDGQHSGDEDPANGAAVEMVPEGAVEGAHLAVLAGELGNAFRRAAEEIIGEVVIFIDDDHQRVGEIRPGFESSDEAVYDPVGGGKPAGVAEIKLHGLLQGAS